MKAALEDRDRDLRGRGTCAQVRRSVRTQAKATLAPIAEDPFTSALFKDSQEEN